MTEDQGSFDEPTEAEIDELLGAYVLDALTDDERRLVEEHLEHEPLARIEADRLALAADWLAESVELAMPPSDLWARISSQLDATAGAAPADAAAPEDPALDRSVAATPSVTTSAPPDEVSQRRDRRAAERPVRRDGQGTRWNPARVALSAAAAVLVVVLIGVGARALTDDDGSAGGTDLAVAAQQAAEQPGSRVAELVGSAGMSARIVVAVDGSAYFVSDGLPALSPDQTYQLWSVVDGEAISVGLLGSDPDATMLAMGSRPGTLAVTVEPVQGSVVATTEAVVAGELI